MGTREHDTTHDRSPTTTSHPSHAFDQPAVKASGEAMGKPIVTGVGPAPKAGPDASDISPDARQADEARHGPKNLKGRVVQYFVEGHNRIRIRIAVGAAQGVRVGMTGRLYPTQRHDGSKPGKELPTSALVEVDEVTDDRCLASIDAHPTDIVNRAAYVVLNEG
jgi:hypothetical protein